jgi:acetyl/propionyl-CoA carboxylase alpha subunit
MVTGIDLVAAQLAIAAGEPLPLRQEDLSLRGHAIECRIAAEDPDRGFLPATGRIEAYVEPGGPGIRVDSGVAAGSVVSSHYDSLLLKVVSHGRDRDEALARMRRALAELDVGGVTTNAGFQRALLAQPDLIAGRVHTRWLEEHADRVVETAASMRREAEPLAAALAAWSRVEEGPRATAQVPASTDRSRWRSAARWTGLP